MLLYSHLVQEGQSLELGESLKGVDLAHLAVLIQGRTTPLREGFKKKNGKKYGLLPNPGGVSEGGQKTKLLF